MGTAPLSAVRQPLRTYGRMSCVTKDRRRFWHGVCGSAIFAHQSLSQRRRGLHRIPTGSPLGCYYGLPLVLLDRTLMKDRCHQAGGAGVTYTPRGSRSLPLFSRRHPVDIPRCAAGGRRLRHQSGRRPSFTVVRHRRLPSTNDDHRLHRRRSANGSRLNGERRFLRHISWWRSYLLEVSGTEKGRIHIRTPHPRSSVAAKHGAGGCAKNGD